MLGNATAGVEGLLLPVDSEDKLHPQLKIDKKIGTPRPIYDFDWTRQFRLIDKGVQYETFDRADWPRPICRARNLFFFFRFSFITNMYYSIFLFSLLFSIFQTISNTCSKKMSFIKNDVFIDSF